MSLNPKVNCPEIFVLLVFILFRFWCEMLISAHFVSLLKLFWCIWNKVLKSENEDCNWQLISHWISNFQFIRLSWIMQMRSFGTFLGIIVMVGLGSTVDRLRYGTFKLTGSISDWRFVDSYLGVFIATMDTHWQISVPDPGHRQVFYTFKQTKAKWILRVVWLNCIKGYGNIVKVTLDLRPNVVDIVIPICNRFQLDLYSSTYPQIIPNSDLRLTNYFLSKLWAP